MVVRVSFVPAPTTSIAPPAAQVRAITSTTAARSASSSMWGSPVVASATTPAAPSRITPAVSSSRLARSTLPSLANGVTRGTNSPAGRRSLAIGSMLPR
jgi:hypothetical protein